MIFVSLNIRINLHGELRREGKEGKRVKSRADDGGTLI